MTKPPIKPTTQEEWNTFLDQELIYLIWNNEYEPYILCDWSFDLNEAKKIIEDIRKGDDPCEWDDNDHYLIEKTSFLDILHLLRSETIY